MKIAIPVDNKSIQSYVSKSFGRALFFLIYNTESETESYLENIAANSQGGAGIKAAQIILDSGANILITPRCGENAAEVIKAGDIKMYKSIDDSISNNINAFNEEKLLSLDEIHPGLHNHGEQ